MSIKQISVFVENKPGAMSAMTGVLAENNIDMRALSLAETSDFGIVRIIVDNIYSATTVLKDAGIPDFRFHALRHSFATRCVEKEFDIKSLSEILGHSSVKITMDRYVHPSMDFKKQQMNRLTLS